MTSFREARRAGGSGSQLEGRVTNRVSRLTFLGLIVYWSLQLVQPFLPIVIWAANLAEDS